ncbi:hypothetical protein M758_11G092900 [Ceratodon purpureus]|nr:hypothetical protein M758_11G092900 [Ceratodon purpureus]
MVMARTYMEGERQRLAGMEANLLHYILVFHACDKKHEALSWNVKYEVTVAEFLRNQGVSNQVVDAHMEIVLQARLHQLMALNVCLQLWHTISTFQSIVATTERVLQVGEELLAVMETKEEIHVSAILREMTGQGITSRIPPRMAGHMCVCGEPCFYPIRAWSAESE